MLVTIYNVLLGILSLLLFKVSCVKAQPNCGK